MSRYGFKTGNKMCMFCLTVFKMFRDTFSKHGKNNVSWFSLKHTNMYHDTILQQAKRYMTKQFSIGRKYVSRYIFQKTRWYTTEHHLTDQYISWNIFQKTRCNIWRWPRGKYHNRVSTKEKHVSRYISEDKK